MKRREFVAAVGLTPWLPGSLAPWLPVARLDRIGIQLYTVRRDFQRDVPGTLARIAEIGFTEVEFAGYPQGTGASLRAMLKHYGLTAPSSHAGYQSLRVDWDRALDEAAAVGQRFIVVPSIDSADRRTGDDWKRVAGLFNRAGEMARERGIQFAYHNHDFEFVPVDGTIGYDVLLAETDPKLVQMELDLYWMTKGGKDPLEYFAKHPGRFPLLHVKDMDATPRRWFANVGAGTIDFKRIFKQAKPAGVKHYFYEQDVTPGAPFDSARASFDYLKALRY